MSLDLGVYSQLSALELATLVREGKVSARELAQAATAAIERINPTLNAILEVYDDAADRLPADNGSFRGVPFLRKDIGATEEGRLQEMGSRLFSGHRADSTSNYMKMIEAAGFVTIGRTACPEFAISSATESVLAGVTRNPWNPDRMAGGSSGGAAVAVATGIVPVAHASDGGGSIRIPGSACGVIGLKPSLGRVSAGPGRSSPLYGLGVEFVMSRNIEDTAAMLEILSQRWPGAPFHLPPLQNLWAAICNHPRPDRAAVRIAVTTDPWCTHPVAGDIAAGVERVAGHLANLGYPVDQAAPSFDFEAAVRVLTIAFSSGMAELPEYAKSVGREFGPKVLEPVTMKAYELGAGLTMADVDKMLAQAGNLRFEVGRFFEDYDILVTPTLAQSPVPHGVYGQSQQISDLFDYEYSLQKTDQFLPIFNITGQPAITLPMGLDSQGLPMGVQLVARPGEEKLLLQVARQVEQALDWNLIPPIHASRAKQS